MSQHRARILDGKAIAQTVRNEVRQQVVDLRAHGIIPGLAVIVVGDDPASHIYVRNKSRACQEVGIAVFDHSLPAQTTVMDLKALLHRLNADPSVHGVLLQLPIPAGLPVGEILDQLDPMKDVDGLLEANVGRLWLGRPRFVPCTPLGVMRLLSEAAAQLRGARAVVIGRSILVGRPMAALLLAADATVTICHSRSLDLADRVAEADVVVAAIGKPEVIAGRFIKPGAVVIDVGINRLADGKLVGDVEFAVAVERAAAITPVPGGVGPLTIAYLLHNTVLAAKLRHGLVAD
ncbi:MAG: bifunctional methylenetetrahydrofolate dehydrogenase/methenyltetrahydrofolate cyclohydrolase FolD [Deltaproteobacteria bacterium]|nr:bifunctional methylenetetrahydrofolate dehydrogenase/methenyltetrahydrofolate cyclohydrolase FolD [Deltaproteobacteria bacterium]